MTALPTAKQFLGAIWPLGRACEYACIVHALDAHGINTDAYKADAIEKLKSAALALGYEVVQRAPAPAIPNGTVEFPTLVTHDGTEIKRVGIFPIKGSTADVFEFPEGSSGRIG